MSEESQVEIPQIDPVELEKEMLAEAARKANDPAEVAAQMFKAYKKGFELSVEKLSAKSTKRLIKALVLAPLEKAPLANQQEHEAYFYANSMLEAKFIMTLTAMNHSAEDIVKGYEDLQNEVKTDFLYGEPAIEDMLGGKAIAEAQTQIDKEATNENT